MIAKKDIKTFDQLYKEQTSGMIRIPASQYIELSTLLRLQEKLTRKLDNYRKSNELWYKSQDENLDDFEDMIQEVLSVEKND